MALKLCKPETVVHFIISYETTKLVIKLLSTLVPDITVHLYDHRPYLEAVREELRKLHSEEYLCLACKRGMVLRSSRHGTPIMGDCLGQVASQTLPNMEFISKNVTVLRPLIGSDKDEFEEVLNDPLAQIVRKISAKECPFKPERVVTRIGQDSGWLESLVYKHLSKSKYLGMRTARELAEMG